MILENVLSGPATGGGRIIPLLGLCTVGRSKDSLGSIATGDPVHGITMGAGVGEALPLKFARHLRKDQCYFL